MKKSKRKEFRELMDYSKLELMQLNQEIDPLALDPVLSKLNLFTRFAFESGKKELSYKVEKYYDYVTTQMVQRKLKEVQYNYLEGVKYLDFISNLQ